MGNHTQKLSSYGERLFQRVVDCSVAKNWQAAVLEWDVTAWDEDETLEESCICGHENLRYLYTITNRVNGNVLVPIGSSCIRKFGRIDLQEQTKALEDAFKLQAAVNEGKFIELTSEFFTKRLLAFLFEEGAFDDPTGRYDAEDTYEFMLKMFNKRKKEDITAGQKKKIRGIIFLQIIPFVKDLLSNTSMKS